MIFECKTWLGIIAVGLTIYAYIPYFKGIFTGTTKPHLFTWLVWTITPSIAAFIQIVEGAGAGAWSVAMAACLCLFITFFSIKYGSKDIQKIDCIFLGISLGAIPLWVMTDNPTLSAMLVTGIQIVASFSTIRKSWTFPEQEVMSTFGLNTVRYILATASLASFSFATAVYPIGMIFMNGLIFAVLIIRRDKHTFSLFKTKRQKP